MAKLSFVLPVYNEEEVLPALFAAMERVIAQLPSDVVELVFVNDGSRDRSYDLLTAYAATRPHVKTIAFSRNFGHQIALTAGLDAARGDAVIVMDSDLQDPPEVALELIRKWREGYGVVYAQRRKRPGDEGALKRITAHWYYRILDALSDIPIPKDTGDFRLLDRRVVEELRRCRERNRYLRGLTSFVGFPQAAVLYDRADRYAGAPKYKLIKQSLTLALDGITGFSVRPLRLISYLGIGTALVSFLWGLYVTAKRIFFPEYTVSGFTIIIILISFLNGVQMLMLGIMGEYIGRTYIESQGRPLYVVRHRLNFDDGDAAR